MGGSVGGVAVRSGRLGFSSGAFESWLVWVSLIGQGARRGWRGVMCWLPCTVMCNAVQGKCWACGNAANTLRVLGGPSRWFGMVMVACTVGLKRVWFGELFRWVEAGLAAR
jgi:hypothetical protein